MSGNRSRFPILVPALLAILAITLLAGCASADRSHRLMESTHGYEARVRWGDFAGALSFVHPSARPDPQRLSFVLQRFEQIRVTGYAPVGRAPSADANTYSVVMELRIVNRHTLTERVLQDRQEWLYEEATGRWWLMTGLPDISRGG